MQKKSRKYVLNPDTLLYEELTVSARSRMVWAALCFVGSLLLSMLYFWLYIHVLGGELPKTTHLKRANARWATQVEILDRRLDASEAVLDMLAMRDEEVYRSVFGMSGIPMQTRNAGFKGARRYDSLSPFAPTDLLVRTVKRLDRLSKKAVVQSSSFDDVTRLATRTGDLASHVPVIPPVSTRPGTFRLSSSFGYRTDPVYGSRRFHAGLDFAMPLGTPIYCTGDGVVESVRFDNRGYGNSVVVSHGFGYRTRYAHMRAIYVAEGMAVKRGECLGESGSTGKATGPHLHYEVLYRDAHVNPYDFMDLMMSPEEYDTMLDNVEPAYRLLPGGGQRR